MLFVIKRLLYVSERIRLKFLDSRITDGRKNFSSNSILHCFRSVAGAITRIWRCRSAHCWEITSAASIVFPSPTSSARTAPMLNGDLKAKRAAIHLMRIQIYLSFCKHTGKFILITRRSTTIELPCKKLLLIGSQCWYVINLCHNLNN